MRDVWYGLPEVDKGVSLTSRVVESPDGTSCRLRLATAHRQVDSTLPNFQSRDDRLFRRREIEIRSSTTRSPRSTSFERTGVSPPIGTSSVMAGVKVSVSACVGSAAPAIGNTGTNRTISIHRGTDRWTANLSEATKADFT